MACGAQAQSNRLTAPAPAPNPPKPPVLAAGAAPNAGADCWAGCPNLRLVHSGTWSCTPLTTAWHCQPVFAYMDVVAAPKGCGLLKPKAFCAAGWAAEPKPVGAPKGDGCACCAPAQTMTIYQKNKTEIMHVERNIRIISRRKYKSYQMLQIHHHRTRWLAVLRTLVLQLELRMLGPLQHRMPVRPPLAVRILQKPATHKHLHGWKPRNKGILIAQDRGKFRQCFSEKVRSLTCCCGCPKAGALAPNAGACCPNAGAAGCCAPKPPPNADCAPKVKAIILPLPLEPHQYGAFARKCAPEKL
jgi:hypothetical protein